MTLTVTKPAATQALCTVQQVRDQIVSVKPGDAAATAELTGLVRVASARIAREIGYEPGRQSYLLTVLTDRPAIILPVPVHPSVTSVETAGEAVQWQDLGAGVVHTFRPSWPILLNIRFDAGWPVTPAVVDVPADLARAAVELAASLWHRRGRSHDISSEDLGGVAGVAYDTQRMPMSVLDVINSYRLQKV